MMKHCWGHFLLGHHVYYNTVDIYEATLSATLRENVYSYRH